MKKKQSNCKRCKAIKRCVFKVRSTCKQEMLQSKALLSENTLQKMLNNGLERSYRLNVEAYERTFDPMGPSFSSQGYKDITIH